MKSFNNQALFIKGGSKPILPESLNHTFTKEDLQLHTTIQSKGDNKNSNNNDNRPRTAIIRNYSSAKTHNRKMIVIPHNQNQINLSKSNINNAGTTTNNM